MHAKTSQTLLGFGFLGALAFSSIVIANNAQGQSSTPATAVPPPPKPGQGIPDTFLQTRRSIQENEARGLQAVGREQSLTGLRSVVRANLRTRNWTFRPNGASHADLLAQDIEAVAQFLATLGYAPDDVAPGRSGGADLLQSAGRIVLGGSSLSDKFRVSPVVVIADLVEVTDNQSLADAYRSTATFRAAEVLKGQLQPDTSITVRQRSGLLGSDYELRLPTELQPGDKGRYVLFLSPQPTKREAVRNRPRPATTHKF